MKHKSRAAALMFVGFIGILAGCGSSVGGSSGGDGNTPKGLIWSFSPSAYAPNLGDTVTFSWAVDNPQSLPCSFDFNGDGVEDKYYASCPSEGSEDYVYSHSGEVTARMELGDADAKDTSLIVQSIYIRAFYYALQAIADCDAGVAGGGEFGWDLYISNVNVSTVGPSNAVLLNDGDVYYFSHASASFEITDLSQELTFWGTVYEYDTAGQLEMYLRKTFDYASQWGILPTGQFWTQVWDVEPGCKVKLFYAVRRI